LLGRGDIALHMDMDSVGSIIVTVPYVRHPIQISERENVAYHEAGHAVAGHLVGRRFTRVSIIADEESHGRCHFAKIASQWNPEWDSGPRTRHRIESWAISCLGGPVAEELFTGVWDDIGATGDERKTLDLLEYLAISTSELEAYWDWLLERTRAMLWAPRHWRSVEALASELMVTNVVGERKAREIIKTQMREVLKGNRNGTRMEYSAD
jgi:hypothetical protein